MAKNTKGDNSDAGDGGNVIDLPADRKGGGVSGVKDMIARGRRANEQQRTRAKIVDPPIGQGMLINGASIPPGQWIPDQFGMAPNCPINVIGKEAETIYIVDSLRQLRPVRADQLGQKLVQEMCGDRQAWLYWAFPGFDKSGKLVRWRNELLVEMIATAAHRNGIVSIDDMVRGRGMWQDEAGKLIFHAGDALFFQGETDRTGALKEEPTGRYGDHIYPARPPLSTPFHEPITGSNNPAGDILKHLQSWHFEREHIDPILMLGGIGAAILGGALLWRPTTFLVGDYGVGKSYLNRFLKQIMGRMLNTTKNITGPAIYRLGGHDALPIAVDELEASSDNRRVMDVVRLARESADGAKLYRTGADGKAQEFTVNGSFFFSAINQPPLGAQDFSRMIVINLRRLKDTSAKPPQIPSINVGRMLVRRMMDEWHRFPQTFDAYREALAAGGHSGRGQDTFGTALACADLLLGPDLLADFKYPVDDLRSWGDWLGAASVPELQSVQDTWLACLMHLFTSRVEAWRDGTRRQIGQVMHDLENPVINGSKNEDLLTLEQARNWLHQAGVGVTNKQLHKHGYVMAIPYKGSLVGALFRGTDWEGQGAAGVWVSALRQGPDDTILTPETWLPPEQVADQKKRDNWNVVKVGGVPQRCVLVSMKGFRERTEGVGQ